MTAEWTVIEVRTALVAALTISATPGRANLMIPRKRLLYITTLVVYLCGFPAVAQITDPAKWLVQGRCADGSPPHHCLFPAPQKIDDPVYYSRHDWPQPNGYSFSHSTIGPDSSFIQNFRFADGGYGGQALYINDDVVVADKTQDAGKTNTYYFTGPNCGGTGWIMFDVNVPTAKWAERLATLGKSDDRQSCGRNYPAWTRTRRDNIAFPFIENDQPRRLSVDTIVSEHYDNRDPIAARLMERFYYGYNWGWLRWERWEKKGTPPSDLPQRCPYVSLSGYPSGGGENWRMVDCRMWTNIRIEDGDSTAQIGWP